MPSASKATLRALLKEIENYSVKVRILPGLAELAQGKVLVSELKEVDIADLLGRFEVEANQDLINRNIKDKVVLITGAGGSIGSEIARQVVRNKAKKIIVLDANEYSLYTIRNELEAFLDGVVLYSVLANVTNKKRMTDICKVFAVDTIYHAAAFKHVSLVEENPFEAVFNNILGTQTCAQAAIDAKVETFVLISTDKAVRPTNFMGATKRFAELVLQALADEYNNENITRMTMVRFGNVLGSSGSAIPLFQQQIKEGGPVTVTDPEVIRYFMSIPEAAELVIQAGAMGKGGDVFVLDMGEPVKILELAKRLISLSGMELKNKENSEGDIEIIFTGLRPGEKLYEELLIGANVSTTEHKQILRAEEDFLTKEELDKYITLLKEAEKEGDVVALKEVLKRVITGFTPEKDIVDVVYNQKQK
jgi:FlaA1/EpsC-like NDP-sugar epimerase